MRDRNAKSQSGAQRGAAPREAFPPAQSEGGGTNGVAEVSRLTSSPANDAERRLPGRPLPVTRKTDPRRNLAIGVSAESLQSPSQTGRPANDDPVGADKASEAKPRDPDLAAKETPPFRSNGQLNLVNDAAEESSLASENKDNPAPKSDKPPEKPTLSDADKGPDAKPGQTPGATRPKVGPGFPPEEYRWKKGNGSPNPGGKKKSPGPEELMAAVMSEKIMTAHGKMRAGKALCLSLRKRAFDPKDKTALPMLERLWSKGAAASRRPDDTKSQLEDLRQLFPEDHPLISLIETLVSGKAAPETPSNSQDKQTSSDKDEEADKDGSSTQEDGDDA